VLSAEIEYVAVGVRVKEGQALSEGDLFGEKDAEGLRERLAENDVDAETDELPRRDLEARPEADTDTLTEDERHSDEEGLRLLGREKDELSLGLGEVFGLLEEQRVRELLKVEVRLAEGQAVEDTEEEG
jgi:hypothetical protein